jgi:hypothetical protein
MKTDMDELIKKHLGSATPNWIMQNCRNMLNELLPEIIDYIEMMEESIDGEWGSGRSSKDLIKDNCMPEIYNKLLSLRDETFLPKQG